MEKQVCQPWGKHRNLVLFSLVCLLVLLVPIRCQAASLLRYGSVGEEVTALQQSLSRAGFDPGPIDGIFGVKTEAALIRFQKSAGIGVDGICGPETRAALDRVLGVSRGGGSLRGRTIVIDAGHGGSDPGAISYWGDKEKDFNFSIASKVRAYLEKDGANVIMTRYGDYSPGSDWNFWVDELLARVSLANSNNADVFVSIHGNSYPQDPGVSGVMGFYRKGSSSSETLARILTTAVSRSSGLRYIDVQQGPYYVLNHTVMPAVLMEVGFLTNYSDVTHLRQNWFQDQVARGLAEGIIQYLGR